MADKYHSDTQPITETLYYAPGVPNSGDEYSDKIISATSKQASPDYTYNLTIVAPDDGRINIARVGVRNRSNPTEYNAGATRLYYSVEVNDVERAAGYWTTTSWQYASATLEAGQFNLGTPNTVKVFLWVDAGNVKNHGNRADIGVGGNETNGDIGPALTVSHRGLMSLGGKATGAGTVTVHLRAAAPAGVSAANPAYQVSATPPFFLTVPQVVVDDPALVLYVADGRYCAWLERIMVVLRSER